MLVALRFYSVEMESMGLRRAALRLSRVTVTAVMMVTMASAARKIHTGTGLWYGNEDTQWRMMTVASGAVTMKQTRVMAR